MKCDLCGKTLAIGDWPYCGGDPAKHEPVGAGYAVGFEPYVDCQLLPSSDPRCTSTDILGRRGVPIYSASDRRAIMKEQGLQFGSQNGGAKER